MDVKDTIFDLQIIASDIEHYEGAGLRRYDAETINDAVKLLEKQIPKPPVPDENATGIDGKPVPRCQVCGYALDLRMEQYCPCCGQRLTEYEEAE